MFEPPFRFSVKTDRAGNAAIERMAKAAGMKPDAFVQAHFEQLLQQAPAAPGEPHSPDPVPLSAEDRIAAQVLKAMSRVAGPNRTLQMSLIEIGNLIEMTDSGVYPHLRRLLRKRHVAVAQKGHGKNPTIYRILSTQGAAA